MKQSKVYFPGLNGLRFFAAMAVVFTHVELMKRFLVFGSHWIDMSVKIEKYPLQSVLRKDISWLSPVIANAGPLGVVFFFVLSGFLITYLLFEEKKVLGDVSIKKFYVRRFLRIWPLYFLVLILGFFVLPNFQYFEVPVQNKFMGGHYWQNFWLYLLFLPNLAFSMFVAIPNVGQLWSIGVEEQFYFIWPILMKKFKNALKVILVFIGIVLAIKIAFILSTSGNTESWVAPAKKFLAMFKIECMALGGLAAYVLYFKKESWLKLIYHPISQILAFISIPLLIYLTPMALQDGVHLIYGISFLVIILNVSTNPKSLVKLQFKWLDYLGKISYGIYMYHLLAIVFVLHVVRINFNFPSDLNAWQNLTVYAMSSGLTILISALSYHFFESRFIRMKKKVTTIVSGDSAAN